MNTNSSYIGKTKRVTVIEREFDPEGRLVKETETVTEYEDNSYKYPSPGIQPWPFGYPIATY